MAVIDYGAILKVNKTIYKSRIKGKKYNPGECELFLPTSESGYIIKEAYDAKHGTIVSPHFTYRVKGNYFVYAGDEHLLVAFYKYQVLIISGKNVLKEFQIAEIGNKTIVLEAKIDTGDIIKISIKSIDPDTYGKYIATWDYNNKHYEVIYGFGIEGNIRVYNEIKNDGGCYDYTHAEVKFIDNWMKNSRVRYLYSEN